MKDKIFKIVGIATRATIVICLFIFVLLGNYVAALFNLAVLFWLDYKPTEIHLNFKDYISEQGENYMSNKGE